MGTKQCLSLSWIVDLLVVVMASVVKLRKNVREGVSLFSALSFWWLREIFTTGCKRPLRLDDLYSPLAEDSSAVLTRRLER